MEPLVINRKKIVDRLQKEILLLEGYKPLSGGSRHIEGLRPIEAAFPGNIFPMGALHEFLAFGPESSAATAGFIGGLLGAILPQDGVCLWISAGRRLFPPALKTFGSVPDRIVFIDLQRDRDVLWAMEEGLKCGGIATVIAEVRELTFMQSRRLQLAVETSKVTGFVLRTEARRLCTTACLTRWQVTPRPSVPEAGMPGVGFPRWEVDLSRVRNGKPGKWVVEWSAGRFAIVEENRFTISIKEQVSRAG